MGLIGRVVSYVLSTIDGEKAAEVKLSVDSGSNVTAEQFAPIGDDGRPLAGDIAITMSYAGREHIVGYVDPKNEGQAASGEKRFYARNASGAVVCSVWLKSDGSLELGSGPTDSVAVSSKTQQAIDAIYTALDAFAVAAPVATDGGAAIQAAFKAVWGPGAPPTVKPQVASSKVKVAP